MKTKKEKEKHNTTQHNAKKQNKKNKWNKSGNPPNANGLSES